MGVNSNRVMSAAVWGKEMGRKFVDGNRKRGGGWQVQQRKENDIARKRNDIKQMIQSRRLSFGERGENEGCGSCLAKDGKGG